MRCHFIGIGGVGMAGLAMLMKKAGNEVSGCDLKPTSRTRWLEREGIRVEIGHDEAHLAEAEEVVYTPAVPADSAEFVLAQKLHDEGRLKLRRRGELLAAFVNAAPDTIAVCGSHGKTTTATWIAKLLRALGESVSWCIGGECGDFPVAGVGSGPLVVEADESDGTLALYRAKTLVVNRCEYDHPDHFPTLADYLACYDQARANAAKVIESERLLPFPELAEILKELPEHNRKNATAAATVALERGHSPAEIAACLRPIVAVLPDRRFQRLAEGVWADYAHHPTELKCAVAMAMGKLGSGGKLRVLFQPHRYSRTKALLKDFPPAFEGVDEVILCPTYAAFESPIAGGDIADLYAELRRYYFERPSAPRIFLAQSCPEAWEHVALSRKMGDVALILGAGDIIALASEVSEAKSPHRKRVFIGAGSNTWRSDLMLAVDYVKTAGRAGQSGAELVAEYPALCPWMAGIPGTVGGWIKMNAGAFGHSFSEVLSEVKVDGEWIPADACGFSYRHSEIAGEIQDFRLKPEAAASDLQAEASFLARRKRFPSGTFGSVFKNPEGDFAGRLLEAAGAKDLRVGGAYVWNEHANVIVRGDAATASDVLALARLMANAVYFRFGIRLEPEVVGLGSLV